MRGRRETKWISFLFFSFILWFGCQKEQQGDPAKLETSVSAMGTYRHFSQGSTQEDKRIKYIEEFSEIMCDLNHRCNLNAMPSSREMCLNFMHNLLRLPSGDYQFFHDKANACFNHLSRISCEEASILLVPSKHSVLNKCRDAVKGFGEVGDECFSEQQCNVDLSCLKGKCRDENLCFSGENCDSLPEHHPCDSESIYSCGPSIYCIEGRCSLGKESGESCHEESAPCLDGLRCFEGTCQYPTLGLDAGMACEDAWRRCKNGLFCEPKALVCVQAPSDGEVCDLVCEPGFICGEDRICRLWDRSE